MKTPYGFFAYFAFVASLYSMTTFYLRKKEFVKIIPVDKNVPFVTMKETWPVVALIDSSGDVEVEPDVNKRL
jgi:hypothetical protein